MVVEQLVVSTSQFVNFVHVVFSQRQERSSRICWMLRDVGSKRQGFLQYHELQEHLGSKHFYGKALTASISTNGFKSS